MTSSEEVFSFPCEISLKAIGKDEGDYRQFVIDTVRKYIPDLELARIHTKLSSDNHFLSVTVPLIAQSREQLDEIYNHLTFDPRTKMLL